MPSDHCSPLSLHYQRGFAATLRPLRVCLCVNLNTKLLPRNPQRLLGGLAQRIGLQLHEKNKDKLPQIIQSNMCLHSK